MATTNLPIPSSGIAQAQAQIRERILAGVVRTESGSPISGAEVFIIGDARESVWTDSLGRFVLRRVPEEGFVVGVRRPGFAAGSIQLPSSWNPAQELVIALRQAAVRLQDVVVEAKNAKPARYAGTTKYDDVLRRMRTGFGSFVTREDIDRQFAGQTIELLRGIPGVHVIVGPPGVGHQSSIRFVRCGQREGKVGVWIDGVKLIPQFGYGIDINPVVEMLARIEPGGIEMIEIYRGVSQIPAEYLDDSCAVVAIWTRRN
ncbi:MAG: carboxypeptidase regulatory-like domain-containing protein [Gemmatimonadales bacterium]